MMFPEAFPKAVPPKTVLTNLKYGGWFGSVKHVFYANGDRKHHTYLDPRTLH